MLNIQHKQYLNRKEILISFLLYFAILHVMIQQLISQTKTILIKKTLKPRISHIELIGIIYVFLNFIHDKQMAHKIFNTYRI